jgi:hypothetical protein
MRELIKSLFRFCWATSLFGVRQLSSALGNGGAGRFADLADATAAQMDGPIKQLFVAGTKVQPGLLNTILLPSNGSIATGAQPVPLHRAAAPGVNGRLNTSSTVVLGEGLAAGMGDFSLSEYTQAFSFPTLVARQMGAQLPQTLIESPGIGDAIGFGPWQVIVPSPLQSTVVKQIPPEPAANLSVPGFTLSDALRLRPRQPLVDRDNAKQTAANMILGVRDIAYGVTEPLATQLEYAIKRSPTFVMVELGFCEALQATISGDGNCLPSRESFRSDYSQLMRSLRSTGAEVLLITVPNPINTAHFSTIEAAARVVKLDPQLLIESWGLQPDDLITANGLNEISFQIFGGSIGPLQPNTILPSAKARTLASRIEALNQEISQIANQEGAQLYDLDALFKRLRNQGCQVGVRFLTGEYLGGFYSLNGYYPGATGHALIANEILALLNRNYGAAFPLVDVSSVMASDPVASYKPAPGANWTRNNLPSPRPRASSPPAARARANSTNPRRLPLVLPAGLEQVLPLNKALSYFGDGISPLNDRTPSTIKWGSGGNLLFGGLAMVDSHLSGNVRIRFTPPLDGRTQFQLSFQEGLVGDDEVLMAPQFFKMAFQKNRVDNIPGFISSGTLDLNTGQVDTSAGALNIFAQYSSTALNALVSVNPTFPRPPAAPLSFPGQYGSASVIFEQRSDGLLDLTFVGSTFVPLGQGIVWPLNFTGPSMQFATIPANGTVMHPHLVLSTRETLEADASVEYADIPVNTLREHTLFTPISSFGDVFTLHSPQLGGSATGRSRLLGRVQIQFGPRCGNSIPIAVLTTSAGGVLAPLGRTPIAQLFPGRLTPGPEGFDANLRFPLRTYSLNDLAVIDDPFDVAIGALDARTGRFLHPMLHRAFINQDLIFGLLRVEPRTPTSSFFFRGDGALQRSSDGIYAFRYLGDVHIPYPEGFLFPDPNLATGFPIGSDSSLDPYLWLWTVADCNLPGVCKSGSADRVLSNRGEIFSYRYSIASDLRQHPAYFEYENHSQGGKFRMHSLAWLSFGTSELGSTEQDTVSFSCFGVWSKDGVEMVVQAAVQISEAPGAPWVGIQVARADISDVDTPMPSSYFPIPAPSASRH